MKAFGSVERLRCVVALGRDRVAQRRDQLEAGDYVSSRLKLWENLGVYTRRVRLRKHLRMLSRLVWWTMERIHKPQFVDLGDEVGELLLEGEGRQGHLNL